MVGRRGDDVGDGRGRGFHAGPSHGSVADRGGQDLVEVDVAVAQASRMRGQPLLLLRSASRSSRWCASGSTASFWRKAASPLRSRCWREHDDRVEEVRVGRGTANRRPDRRGPAGAAQPGARGEARASPRCSTVRASGSRGSDSTPARADGPRGGNSGSWHSPSPRSSATAGLGAGASAITAAGGEQQQRRRHAASEGSTASLRRPPRAARSQSQIRPIAARISRKG